MTKSHLENASPVQMAVSEAVAALHEGTGFSEAWERLESFGIARLSIPKTAGGDGGGLAEAGELLRAAGYYGLCLPVAETTLLAGWVLSVSGISVPRGPLTLAPLRKGELRLRNVGTEWLLHGTARRVPWASEAGRLVVIDLDSRNFVFTVSPNEGEITNRKNLAGEPRDDIHFDSVRVEGTRLADEGVSTESIKLRGMLARTLALAGALDRVLELSVEHAGTRQQFGRNIGSFQAIQQQLALLAGEVAAVDAAVSATLQAVIAADDIRWVWGEIISAKARASAAAGVAASIAHQVHGAVGFTERHPLHRSTLRLWSWREEFGNDVECAEILGGRLATLGGARLWDAVIDPASTIGDVPQI